MTIKYKPVKFSDVKFFVEQTMTEDKKVIFGCYEETKDSLMLFVMFDIIELKTGRMMSIPKSKITENCEKGTCIIFSKNEFKERYPNYKKDYVEYVKKNNIKPDPMFNKKENKDEE